MSVLKQIKKVFETSKKKHWYKTYWAFDVHDTIFKPNYDLNQPLTENDFYSYAKETLQLLTKLDHIIMILWTSSYPHEIKEIIKLFNKHNIKFDYIGNNPEISSNKGNFGYYNDKFYFNVMFEDKAGFEPYEWKDIYTYLQDWLKFGDKPKPEWSTKY